MVYPEMSLLSAHVPQIGGYASEPSPDTPDRVVAANEFSRYMPSTKQEGVSKKVFYLLVIAHE